MPAAETFVPWWQIFLSNSFHLVGIIIYFYDYLLTFQDEFKTMWKSSRSAAWWLFFLNRYLSFFVNIYVLYVSFGHFETTKVLHNHGLLYTQSDPSDISCSRATLFRQLALVLCQLIVNINLFLRIYALYNRDNRVVYGTVALGVISLALGSWATSNSAAGRDSGVNLSQGCHGTINSEEGALHAAVSWEILFAFDAVIFVLTVCKGVRRPQVQHSNIFAFVIRHGALYFVVMACAHLANTVTYYTLRPELKGTLSTLSSNISVTMVSRFMLMLHRETYERQDATTVAPTTMGTGSTKGKSEQAMFTTLASSVPNPGPLETSVGNRESLAVNPGYPDARNDCMASGPGSLGATGGKGKERCVDPAFQV